jgi:hypothetical protein
VTKIYFVMNRDTGEMALPHGYTNARDAKLAMKCHKSRKAWTSYVVASVEAPAFIESYVNQTGEWVSANDAT